LTQNFASLKVAEQGITKELSDLPSNRKGSRTLGTTPVEEANLF